MHAHACLRFYTPAMQRGARRLFYLWTAVFAILWCALAPTITQAMQGRGDAGELSVCTQFGPKGVAADSAAPAGKRNAPAGAHPYEHCPYCSLHAAGLGMPPPAFDPPALPLAHAVHWRYSAATPTLAVWSDALSRGPPSAA
jgi:hypothetical protein